MAGASSRSTARPRYESAAATRVAGRCRCWLAALRGKLRTHGAAPRCVLASGLRCDREVRCDTGAAPATVSGEPAAQTTGPQGGAGKAPPGDDPEPGDLRIAWRGPFLGRRSSLWL